MFQKIASLCDRATPTYYLQTLRLASCHFAYSITKRGRRKTVVTDQIQHEEINIMSAQYLVSLVYGPDKDRGVFKTRPLQKIISEHRNRSEFS